MRPDSIRQFEYFYWASIGLAVANMLLSWWAGVNMLSALGPDRGTSSAVTTGMAIGAGVGLLFGVILPLILAFFAARRAAEWAKWVIVGLGAFGALRLVALLFLLGFLIVSQAPTPQVIWLSMAIGIFTEIFHMGALSFLFFPDAREYYALKGAAPSYQHEEVFG